MTKISLEWVADSLSRFDILDLHITLSDLIDIPISDEQAVETAYYDTMALREAEKHERGGKRRTPLGKLVL